MTTTTLNAFEESRNIFTLYQSSKTRGLAQEKAIILLQPYIKHQIYNYLPNINNYERDDIMQACNIAVLQTLDTYNPNNNTTLITWCRLPIQYAITKEFHLNYYGTSPYLYRQCGGVQFTDYEDYKENIFVTGLDEMIIANEQKKFLLNLLDNLQPIEKYVLMQNFGIDCTPRKLVEIATTLNIADRSARYHKAHALRKLRKMV